MATILLVDDEVALRQLYRSIFKEELGHTILAAASLAVALKIFGARAIDLVFTDLDFPEGKRIPKAAQSEFSLRRTTSGKTLIEAIWSVRPDTKCILITGALWTVESFINKNRSNPNFALIEKPAGVSAIITTVERLLRPEREAFDIARGNLSPRLG